jgi:hypothetical protein
MTPNDHSCADNFVSSATDRVERMVGSSNESLSNLGPASTRGSDRQAAEMGGPVFGSCPDSVSGSRNPDRVQLAHLGLEEGRTPQ